MRKYIKLNRSDSVFQMNKIINNIKNSKKINNY